MSNIEKALKSAIATMNEYHTAMQDSGFIGGSKLLQCVNQCKSALAEVEKCEPVNEVYEFEKWITGNTLIRTNLSINLDYADPLAEIAYRAWKARAKLYTSPQQREWVGLSEEIIDDIGNTLSDEQGFIPVETWTEFANAISEKLKQLNMKG